MKGSTKKTLSLLTIAALIFVVNAPAKAESRGVQDSAQNATSITLNKPVEGADEVYTAPTGTNVVFFKQSNGKVVVLTLTALTTEQQAQLQADLLASHTDPSIKEDDQFYYIVGEGTYNLKEMLDDKAWGTEYIVEVNDEGIITITYQDGKISHYTPFCVVTPTPTLSPSPTPTPFEPTPTPFEPTPTPFEPTPTPFEPTPTPFEPTPTPFEPTPTPFEPTPTPFEPTPTPFEPTPTPFEPTPTPFEPTPTPFEPTPTPFEPTPTPFEPTPTPTVFITPTPVVSFTPTPVITNTPGPSTSLPPEPPKTGVEFDWALFATIGLLAAATVVAVVPNVAFESGKGKGRGLRK